MSLVITEHLSLLMQVFKNLLSKKADKTELKMKIDRSEIEEEDAIGIVTKLNLVSPVAAEDGSIYTDENGAPYSL
jgi:hypothetical protein